MMKTDDSGAGAQDQSLAMVAYGTDEKGILWKVKLKSHGCHLEKYYTQSSYIVKQEITK